MNSGVALKSTATDGGLQRTHRSGSAAAPACSRFHSRCGADRLTRLRAVFEPRQRKRLRAYRGMVVGSTASRRPLSGPGHRGEQGSAKTILSKILRSIIDPNVAPVRVLPRDERELFVAASNSHVLAFDNLSGLSPWLSDTLCRLASGGAFSTRRLFTDQDEILFAAARPVILNGIEDIVTRPDLSTARSC